MKNIVFLIIIIASLFFTSCEKEEISPITPSQIKDVKAFQLPGQIGLTWTNVEPIKYQYINIKYHDHLTKKDISMLVSRYADTVIIDNTRAKYGDYTFTFQPISSTRTEGKKITLKAKSGAYIPEVSVAAEGEEIHLTKDMLSTVSQEPSEGAIENLIDGDPNTFFHTAWSIGLPWPHSFQINLVDKKVRGFSFYYKNKHSNANGCMKDVILQGSNDGTNWKDIKHFTSAENLPNGVGTEYTSPAILADKEYSQFKFVVNETHNGGHFMNMAEFKFFEHEVTIYDPENSKEDI